MYKKKKCMLLAMLMMLCLVISGVSVSASNYYIGESVDGSLLTDKDEAGYTENSKAKGTYLASGTGGVTNLGGRQIYVSGGTNCHRVSDQVKVTLYLQRLEGGAWVNTGNVVSGTSYNTYQVSAGNTFSVTGGYFYRVYGSHVVIKGNTSEACYSWSDGIWIP